MKSYLKESGCSCGKCHTAAVDVVVTGSGVLARVPEFVEKYGAKRPFLLADKNTWKAAGERLAGILQEQGIEYSSHVYVKTGFKPDEHAVGNALMHFDTQCDLIIGIGSGVINDIGKILSRTTGRKYIIVATAPSMDGYASATSSMDLDGVKVSLNSRCADVIVGDTDILKEAPLHMLKTGLGDMLAKYISIAEWRIAHIITGEYYCEEVAQLMRGALKRCTDNAAGLLQRKPEAVEAVFEGLVIGGLAMAYAGVSRPASGVEHYFSHVWDMRALEFGLQSDLHGIQCAMGTLLASRLYEQVKTLKPDWETANTFVQAFFWEDWSEQLKAFFGSSADTMIALEAKEGKYRKETHKARFEIIREHWDEILQIIGEEIPSYDRMEELLDILQIPKDPAYIGVDKNCLRQTFRTTKDLRDKYNLARLAWDLGILEDLCQLL